MKNRVKKAVHKRFILFFIGGGLLTICIQAIIYCIDYSFVASIVFALLALFGAAVFIREEFHVRQGGRYWFTLWGGPTQPYKKLRRAN